MIVNAKSIVQHVIQINKWNNKTRQCECKKFHKCKRDYSWHSSTCICENGKYLKSIADISEIACDEIIAVADIVSTKIINTIATYVSIISDYKKIRYKIDCYFLHTVLLVIILLLIISIICYHYAKHRSKQKIIDLLTIRNGNKMNFKRFVLKTVRVVIPMTKLN